jgi:L-alanine-DL-glutamate epimerase-like enolase superfamily enzyme
MTNRPALVTEGPDRITQIRLRSVRLPLANPVSDAKVLTGRQRPITEVAMLFADVFTADGAEGMGFSYSKRAGGEAQFAHAREVAPTLIGLDANDIQRSMLRLLWAGASVGRSGVATQAIAAIDNALWDLKAKRARLPLAKLIGSHHDSVRCYNTSGGFLHTPIDAVIDNAVAAVESGIGGIKLKVGHPDGAQDLDRVRAVREALGSNVPLMVDANQQWDRPTALRMGRALEEFDLVWIEEPLDAYDVRGHAELATRLDTPIATGEMLTSVREHRDLLDAGAADIIQPDAPRVGGTTPFLRLLALADEAGVGVAPHFAMELHVHLAATCAGEPWVEHFDWLEPLFDQTVQIADGRMVVPTTPGIGLTVSDRALAWTTVEEIIR